MRAGKPIVAPRPPRGRGRQWGVPEPDQSAERRRAVDALRIAEAVAGYAARQVGNGLGPEEARQAVASAALELEQVAASLRRLARPDPVADSARRRAAALELAADGWDSRAIAERLGVVPKTAQRWLRAGRGSPNEAR